MKRCKRCVQPDSNPRITLNKEGICNHCLADDEYKKTDWNQRGNELKELCDKYRKENGDFDCIIAVSGGKDSHFQVGLFKERLDMNPLCVSLDNASWTQTGRKNIQNLNERFDVSILTLTPARKTLKSNITRDFIEKLHPMRYWDSLLYEYPYVIAKQFDIHFVIWGEDTHHNNEADAGKILSGRYNVPFDIIFTSYYVPWNRYDNLKYAKENGFQDLKNEWNRIGLQGFEFEQVDTIGYLTNQYCKFVKFGFSSQTELCSDSIRDGKMTRKEAIEQVNAYDWQIDPLMIDDFCRFIEIDLNKFWETIDWHANQNILEKKSGYWRLKKPAK